MKYKTLTENGDYQKRIYKEHRKEEHEAFASKMSKTLETMLKGLET